MKADRAALTAGSARRINLERFWQYLPVFYLGALRDADDEFSSRSQFWGRLLKAMVIPPALENRVQRVLDLLNKKLLRADPRLQQIADTLSGATKVAARDRDGGVALRLVPLKSWDLLSQAGIIARNETTWPWHPLQRHGQGMQSLSVIFLFQAFVEHLLAELHEADSSPVLALEEPETHLHPQASRTLWGHAFKGCRARISLPRTRPTLCSMCRSGISDWYDSRQTELKYVGCLRDSPPTFLMLPPWTR